MNRLRNNNSKNHISFKKGAVLRVTITLLLCFSSSLWSRGKLTLAACLKIALKQNAELKSQYHRYDAAIARVRQAYAFPQPEISLDYDLQPKMFQFGQSSEQYIGVSQTLEFPGRRLIRGKIAKKESKKTYWDLERTKLDLMYEVKKAFYELLVQMDRGNFSEENYVHASEFLEKVREKYQSGDVSKLEILRAGVEEARAQNLLKTAVYQISLAKARLNFLLARERRSPLEIQGSLKRPFFDLNLEDLCLLLSKNSPEIKKARLAINKERLNKIQASLSYLPDLNLGVSRHRINGEESTWDVTLSFQVPLFFWQPVRGEIAEVKANILAEETQLKQLELSASLEVESAFQNATIFRDQIVFFAQKVLAEAETVYQMSMISYKEGKSSSLEVMEARRTLIELKQANAETQLNYLLTIAELERLVGVSLEALSKTHQRRLK